MKRTQEWWARLTKEERSTLVYLEHAEYHSGGCGYLPDDCSECGGCGFPSVGGPGLCTTCSDRLEAIINKASTPL